MVFDMGFLKKNKQKHDGSNMPNTQASVKMVIHSDLVEEANKMAELVNLRMRGLDDEARGIYVNTIVDNILSNYKNQNTNVTNMGLKAITNGTESKSHHSSKTKNVDQKPQKNSVSSSNNGKALLAIEYSESKIKSDKVESMTNTYGNQTNRMHTKSEIDSISNLLHSVKWPDRNSDFEISPHKNNDSVAISNRSEISLVNNGKKNLNILVLGETGVGKSTWINAFANYLAFKKLEDALAETPICVIPTNFTVFDNNRKQYKVILGEDKNEVFKIKGQSRTQNAKVYFFESEIYNVYLIDTPGINDTRGAGQDDENIQKILRTIAPFNEIHAICLLFKPNETRLKDHFRFSINKLLSNLSQKSLKNICIVFTHTRGTLYKPGETMGLLNSYFDELKISKGLSVDICDDNVFCLDNEGFRYCCTYFGHPKLHQDKEEMEDYSGSWEQSVTEIQRLLHYAARLRPYNVSETLSINDTRTWIMQLVDPITKVSENIQLNLEKLENSITELNTIKCSIDELRAKAAVPIFELKIKELPYPRTVCKSVKCVHSKIINGTEHKIFKICHDHCFLDGNLLIKHCIAFDTGDFCIYCGCHVNDHHRIFYEQNLVTNDQHTETLQKLLEERVDGSQLKQIIVENCKELITKYESELFEILKVTSVFSLFLQNSSAIEKYDIFEKNIRNAIDAQYPFLNLLNADKSRLVSRMKFLLSHYLQIRQTIHDSNDHKNLTLSDLQYLRQSLFALPLSGQTLAEIFDIHVKESEQSCAENVVVCESNTIIAKSKQMWSVVTDKLANISPENWISNSQGVAYPLCLN